ncbi:MAG: tRNA (adenosine(37)-N6)-threonylcarbamoyltransferase complex dimerization subunit type 1 TsaB [Clostridiales bacterium]|jgi:tRNA threonylcarbamoyladenosine biosynthesis protein TsaB|nr:tRNA (adenosine(37)-N6)-threonylcarbamoyltransferase complex dimerization subunit type 1 TsaB [Clostridiales bacterium]
MKILAVETACSTASAALLEDKIVLAEFSINNKKSHSVKLIPLIKDLLEYSGFEPGDIDIFACDMGPGSFTGLRIGVVTVKTLGFALDKPAVGVVSLDALAHSGFAFKNVYVCPVIDARNSRCYTSLYFDGKRCIDYCVMTVDGLTEEIKKRDYPVLFCGDGVQAYGEQFKERLGGLYGELPPELLLNKASCIGEIVWEMHLKGGKMPEAEPFYLRPSQAERLKNGD